MGIILGMRRAIGGAAFGPGDPIPRGNLLESGSVCSTTLHHNAAAAASPAAASPAAAAAAPSAAAAAAAVAPPAAAAAPPAAAAHSATAICIIAAHVSLYAYSCPCEMLQKFGGSSSGIDATQTHVTTQCQSLQCPSCHRAPAQHTKACLLAVQPWHLHY